MEKDFTKKRISKGDDFYKVMEIARKNAKGLNEYNIAMYWKYCFAGLTGQDEEKVEFVNLVKSMVELDNQFEDWKHHLDKSKTIEQVLSELKVYIDKFDEINEKLRTISHYDAHTYTSYCTSPEVTLKRFVL